MCRGATCRHYLAPVAGSITHGVAACVLAIVEANEILGEQGMTLEDVAQYFGISRVRVGQIEARALRKLGELPATLGEVEPASEEEATADHNTMVRAALVRALELVGGGGEAAR